MTSWTGPGGSALSQIPGTGDRAAGVRPAPLARRRRGVQCSAQTGLPLILGGAPISTRGLPIRIEGFKGAATPHCPPRMRVCSMPDRTPGRFRAGPCCAVGECPKRERDTELDGLSWCGERAAAGGADWGWAAVGAAPGIDPGTSRPGRVRAVLPEPAA